MPSTVHRPRLIGRDEELAVIGEHLGQPVSIVVRGSHGAGKTALLHEVASECRDRGVKAVIVDLASAEDWDLFGVHGVRRALRAGFADVGGSRLASALDTVKRLCTPAAYDSSASRARLHFQLQRLFETFRGTTSAVVLFDGVDAAPTTVITAMSTALRAGCTVIAACDGEIVVRELTSLNEAAGLVIALKPLCDRDVGRLVAAATRHQPDPAVASRIRGALGSLAGNPGAVLAVRDLLISRGRLTYVGGAMALADPAAPIPLPAEHWLVRLVERTSEFGLLLLASIADSAQFSMDDLALFAAVVGGELGACGRAVDDLTAIGALRCSPDGVLTIACPALGAAAIDSVGADRLRALHLGFARRLASRNQSLGHVLFPLADHLAAAGGADAGELDAARLLEHAVRQIRPVNPLLAARCQRAALAHCEPADRSRLLGELLRELIRIGRYDWLREVCADATRDSDTCDELATATCLAALHTGIALPSGAADASTAPIVERWFGAGEIFDTEELARALIPLGGTQAPSTSMYSIGTYDPIGMFESVLGLAYGVPKDGPLFLCRRIMDDYRAGRWEDALSGARTSVATYEATTPVHELVRLLAAEMCGRRGELDLARGWLGASGRRCAFPTLRAWVELGLLLRGDETDAVLEHGWHAYATAVQAADTGHAVGLHDLIIRLALLTTVLGGGAGSAQIEEAARAWCRGFDKRRPSATELMVTAVAHGSYPAAAAAAAALRAKGRQTELATACMLAARSAEDPVPWLHATAEIAEKLGDTWLHASIKSFARRSGTALPRRTTGSRSTAIVEDRVIELIQQGMTNRQIAAAIQLSEKSVERHLTKLLAKTGCRSRVDLIAAHRRGGPAGHAGI